MDESKDSGGPSSARDRVSEPDCVKGDAIQLEAPRVTGHPLEAIKARSEDRRMQAALYAALAAAQGEFKPIAKNRTVRIASAKGSYTFRYADLEAILTATRPAMAKNGLALVQTLESMNDGSSLLTTQIVHKDGGRIMSEVKLPRYDNGDPKSFGGLVTYYRRYAACPMLGVSADDDLDENGEAAQSQEEAEAAELRSLLAAARVSAAGGLKKYQEFWDGTSAADKKLLVSHHAGLKKQAAEADKAAKAEAAAATDASGEAGSAS